MLSDLVFCEEESQCPENTQNIYIEGDNLDALSLLQAEYQNKIRVIYIDPPYNTGKNFIYKDNFKNWRDFIYPRIELSRHLLTDDGVIFISIGVEEVNNLKNICDEIFGKENFITEFIYEKTQHFGRQKLNAYSNAEFILCYAKQLSDKGKVKELLVEKCSCNLLDAPIYNALNNPVEILFPANSVRFRIKDGIYQTSDSKKYELLNAVEIKHGVNKNSFTMRFRSRWSAKTVLEEIQKGTRFLIKTRSFAIRAIYQDNRFTKAAPKQIIFTNPNNPVISRFGERVKTSENATNYLRKMLGGNYFNYPKEVSLITYLISLIYDEKKQDFSNDFTVLDFFSGSGTTGEACMQLNSYDNGKRKFILIQKPETITQSTLLQNSKYKTICDIGKARLFLAGPKIQKNSPNTDVGFKVYKIR